MTVQDLADVTWDNKTFCWKSCNRNTCSWNVHPDLKNYSQGNFTFLDTRHRKLVSENISATNWGYIYLVYKSGLRLQDVPKPSLRKRPLPLSKVAFSSLSMIREFWMSRPPIPPTPSTDLFLSFAIGREISGINSELPFSKFIFGNSQVFSKR